MLGKVLKELRLERKVTQEQLGNTLGVKKNTISQWESETNEPNSGMIIKLADYFDVSTDYLLGRTDIAGVKINNTK